MEIATYVFGFLVVVFGTGLGIASLNGHRYTGLWFGVATLIAAVLGGGCWLHDFWTKRDGTAKASSSGTLTAGNGGSRELSLLQSKVKPESKIVLLGSTVGVIADKLPYTVVRQDGEDMISIDGDSNSINVSAQLFDAFGNQMGDVVNNNYSLHLPQGYTHVAGPHHLTILDETSSVVAKFEIINPRAIHIEGSFHLRGGEPIVFAEHVTYASRTIGELSLQVPPPALDVDGGKLFWGGQGR